MYSRMSVCALLMAAALLILAPNAMAAIPACDSFGQDWQITLGAFGGTFPGTALISGCRDCDQSLGCGGVLPLDGARVNTKNGTLRIWSLTAYRPSGSSCLSSHWTGVQTTGKNLISGNVSNENGFFGTFTLTLRTACAAAGVSRDPASGVR
jgi:hypothetical protein